MNRRRGFTFGEFTIGITIIMLIVALAATVHGGIKKIRNEREADRELQHDYNRLQSLVDFKDDNIHIVAMPGHLCGSFLPALTAIVVEGEDGTYTTPDGWIIKHIPTTETHEHESDTR